MGGGKSSGGGTTTVQMTPEQRQLLAAQTNFLTQTAYPAYQTTIQGGEKAYQQAAPAATKAAQTAMDVAAQTGQAQQLAGTAGLAGGMAGLASLFDPKYKEQQVQAALQSGREATREQLAGQNAMYGGAGGLGSARQALADVNLRQLGEQRQATAAATAAGQVEANRAGYVGYARSYWCKPSGFCSYRIRTNSARRLQQVCFDCLWRAARQHYTELCRHSRSDQLWSKSEQGLPSNLRGESWLTVIRLLILVLGC